MSFILDALKKSESERQQNRGGEFASVPASADPPSAPRWLWVLALLLAVNIVALAYLALRPAENAADRPVVADVEPAPVAATTPAASPPASPDFAARVAAARASRPEPAAEETPVKPAPRTPTPPAGDGAVPPAADTGAAGNALLLPSYTEVRLNGDTDVPELHIDIHVFSARPKDRFVFINMNKYRERERLEEGPVVHEITPDGVVLEHRGTRFLLPRE